MASEDSRSFSPWRLDSWKDRGVNLAIQQGKRAAQKRYTRFWHFVDLLAYHFHRYYQNSNYDFETNGELRAIQVLSKFDLNCIFDVGANVGEWSCLARQHCPDAQIHAFEIADPTFQQLSDNIGDAPNTVINNCGLADVPGIIPLHFVEKDSVLSSAVKVIFEENSQTIDASVATGDDYLENNHLDSIDLLKIDTEGMDGKVLQGFSKTLKTGKIRFIQFEYGIHNIYANFLLKDFYALLEAHGYQLGKIYPRYVDFHDYSWYYEDFIGPNYLAVLAHETDAIKALENPSFR
ncbi:FkbM family methyltransferase [cf. Phormidesmis sp. LEGE 11477]|uniref:FkbM family methyltransferase n=1 Tax=cf. Phormidesmis sp. LEGE 11477 TaxID=1828680 RepID=UPI0018826D01|nr:FkbM family methyltransferase [cf. Phormidesmis sp. LEGE 11477]MBE9059873.1 FkbM family methyltransferase [cf. Phormidesmis sp. LEGE 11477]